MTGLGVGDILAIRSGGIAAGLIRLGAALGGQPDLSNHIAIVHHEDASGQFWWLLEGRPGGVGWADSREYAGSKWLLNNCGQPGRSAAARAMVAAAAVAMLGTEYDWEAITDDTLKAFRMPALWAADWHGKAPGHVVCSSFAAFLYERQGWAHPAAPDRDTEPGDWDAFILDYRYNTDLP